MKKLLMIAVVALIATACSKDQRVVNKLEGTWKATKWTFTDNDGASIDLIGTGVVTEATMNFSDCKLKTDEWCDLTTTLSIILTPTETDNFLYRVTGDGTIIETKDDQSSVTVNQIEIVEITRKTMKTKQEDEDGTIEASFEKQ